MIFYLHYILLTSGLSGTSVLLGVFLKAYSDASQAEIGVLLMSLPFITILIRLIFCSWADRTQAYRPFLVGALCVMLLGFLPLIIVPFFADFYTKHPRLSWYLLVVACYIGNGGLAVAWSLGESLAINKAQKTKTPYSRMRLMGTVSWGVYGYIIGQINEVPYLPKFVPAFIILNISVLLEIVLLLLWDKDDFIMFDASSSDLDNSKKKETTTTALPSEASLADKSRISALKSQSEQQRMEMAEAAYGTCAGGANLSLSSATGAAVRDLLAAESSEELDKKLSGVGLSRTSLNKATSSDFSKSPMAVTHNKMALDKAESGSAIQEPLEKVKKNPQMVLFKLICAEDGRVIKYFILFAMVGILLAPINFVFLSLDDLCREKGCNFSNLAGLVLVSQAACETVCFLLLPWILRYVSRSLALCFGFFILAVRYLFYAQFYYTANISPYWALIGEWGHGMAYSIFATILADVALMFANQTRWFIPEMRQLGYMSDEKLASRELREAEETSMKMALRATMQALISGLMEGVGMGFGSLICGLVVEAYSYIRLWQLLCLISALSLVWHQVIELTRCRWSDTFRPRPGTKAYEMMAIVGKEEKKKVAEEKEQQSAAA